mgnify:FL=1
MSIQMIGIDHTKASIDVRTVFSFTKKAISETLEKWKEKQEIAGCIILSTCNRMEIWISTAEGDVDLYEMLCQEKKIDPDDYREYVISRREGEAVHHLFELACGLQSRILGEDQIITQVKDALSMAREQFATDNVLEVLFRMAVTAAKKVKTEVVLSDANSTAIHKAVQELKDQGYLFEGKTCMVIGNGEMGKLSANVFKEQGASVTVTVRQYRSGVVQIPPGCERIDYGRRLELLPSCDYVVSATSSPNYTLTKEAIESLGLDHDVIMIDLAVPRDIETAAGELEHVTLYDIDYFKADHTSEQVKENIKKAESILDIQMHEFFDWYEGRDIIKQVQMIKKQATEDFHLRIQKQVKDFSRTVKEEAPQEAEQIDRLQEYVESAAGKVINKIIFGMKSRLSDQAFRECIEAMGEVFQE